MILLGPSLKVAIEAEVARVNNVSHWREALMIRYTPSAGCGLSAPIWPYTLPITETVMGYDPLSTPT